ncbi:hypothetical protein JK635_07430 [Neobacillus sp. YIM B02564]|uniref:DUF559 domain-containing protein n=1 Tax=Neobacillus paridis TaxID=2803862 RepID=A0ABS1TL44_9BACI|nr:hypothetical protein [Neobacillus paridis]MBL4952040.1 hypothetical protein [Neobacillus paridis]
MGSNIIPEKEVPSLENGKTIVYEEELPFPYVHYPSNYGGRGAFFAFQQTEDSPLFHCSCQKKGIEVYLLGMRGLSGIPVASNDLMIQRFLEFLPVKDKLCHICNKVAPKYGYGKTFGGTKFYSIYGHYINGLAYEYGIDYTGHLLNPELIPSDIVPMLITSENDDKRLDEQSTKDFIRYCENVIRSRMGYFPIGKRWTSEIRLLELVRRVYPNYTVIHQYEIDHLRADIYIEELQLVIEYQGEQHFKPFAYMGGEEGLRKTQTKDQEKVELCNYYKLGIVYFSYQDELTEKLVKDRITSHIKEKSMNYSI